MSLDGSDATTMAAFLDQATTLEFIEMNLGADLCSVLLSLPAHKEFCAEYEKILVRTEKELLNEMQLIMRITFPQLSVSTLLASHPHYGPFARHVFTSEVAPFDAIVAGDALSDGQPKRKAPKLERILSDADILRCCKVLLGVDQFLGGVDWKWATLHRAIEADILKGNDEK